ncbi:uncharacterized protein [Periplaneta americana]|uniref:uncharacterized protein n=1 Tax=Periplaneta americana TaxID=6978 RepID=UPI0037E8023C
MSRMSLWSEPQRLEVLSLRGVTEFFVDEVIKSVKQEKLEDGKMSIFRHKEQGILYKNVPPPVAKILAHECLQELDARKNLLEFRDVLKEIVQIFLPSRMSELHIDWHWSHIGEIILNGNTDLSGLKTLEVLRQSRAIDLNARYTLQIKTLLFENITDLRELTLHDICSDEILSIVCKTCRNIETLDVTGSRDVTDAIIEPLVELENLEKLSIKYTCITIKGTESILGGLLTRKRYKLTSFACTRLNQDILFMLTQFPNLESLSITSDISGNITSKCCNFSIDPISGRNCAVEYDISLQNLQDLQIDEGKFGSYPSLLDIFGKYLERFEISAAFVDISVVAKRCPLLSSLHLRTNVVDIFSSTVFECPSLRSLSLVMASNKSPTPLLSVCNNLTYLELCANLTEYIDDQHIIFQSSALENLEVLCIASNDDCISRKVVRNFQMHCTNLRSIKVFGKNYLELKEKFRSYHGVEVSSKLCLNIADELIRMAQMIGPNCRFKEEPIHIGTSGRYLKFLLMPRNSPPTSGSMLRWYVL